MRFFLKDQEASFNRILSLILSGLIVFSFIILQNLITSSALDIPAFISLLAFCLAIPLMAGWIFISFVENELKITDIRSNIVSLSLGGGVIADVVGILAAIWRASWIATIVFALSVVFTLIVHGKYYFKLDRMVLQQLQYDPKADQEVRDFEIGGDVFTTKPFQLEELMAHIRKQIRREKQQNLSPLLVLPGSSQIQLAIQQRLKSTKPWSILYIDLDHFEDFKNVYGYLTGEEVIRLVGSICQRLVREDGNPDDFVGHVEADDFVIVTTPDRSELLIEHLSAAYKKEITVLFNPEDLQRGYISGMDRKGHSHQFPLIPLSIGVVNNQIAQPNSIQQVSYLAEAKSNFEQSTKKNEDHK